MADERDEYFIGERVLIDCTVKVLGVTAPTPPGLDGTTYTLTILPPPDDNDVARDDIDVTLDATGVLLHGEYDTEWAGWHEWRLETTGAIRSVQQGRFRVIPKNV
jgi:hypothetical protein